MNRYLEAFKAVSETAKSSYKLMGDCLLVEVIKEEEFEKKVTTDSGKVVGIIMDAGLSSKSQRGGLGSDKPTFARVLMIGEGYDGEEGKKIPLDTKPGDIILIPSSSVKNFSVFGKLVSYGETSLGMVRDSEIQMRFDGQEGFDTFFNTLNEVVTNG